jgi:hypothetical protein
MKTSNLAQRLEQYEADLESLRPARPARVQLTLARDGADRAVVKPARRNRRVGGILLRDGGLKPFRVR